MSKTQSKRRSGSQFKLCLSKKDKPLEYEHFYKSYINKVKMTPHEIFIQYMKIAIVVIAFVLIYDKL